LDQILNSLAEFASDLSYRDLPANAVTASKERLLDTLGCAVGAFDCDTAEIGQSLAGPAASKEVAGRIIGSKRLQMRARLRERGWDQGFAISIGAAAGLANLLSLTREAAQHAISITAVANMPLPVVSTIAESGYAGYEAVNWFGMVAPARTPDEIVRKLNAAMRQVVNLPEVREHYENRGAEPMTTTPEEMRAFLRREIDKWAAVVRTSGARLD
jgi:hypothetical protein